MGFVKCVVFFVLVVAFMTSFSVSYTDPFDVIAMNSLYVGMEYPNLIGWLALGGDPCLDAWQGVSCVFSSIKSLKLNGLNLGGTLNSNFGLFTSIIEIDISDNHIGGDIPLLLPSTLRNFSLARNQFSGRIPDALYSLTQLLNLSFHKNQLSGEIPDVFQEMTSLINLDLSGNNLSGRLPPSMGILSSLTTLHLQSNRLNGTLDVLQDLPLEYLNVENNLFSGPIPEKLLGIPNFRKDGNPFDTSITPSPPPVLSPFPGTLPVSPAPWKEANRPSASETPNYKRSKGFFTSKRVIWIAVTGVVVIIILGACLLWSTCYKERKENKDIERHDVGAYESHVDELNSKSSVERNNQEKVIIIPGACLLWSTCYKGRKENKDIERHDVGTYKSHVDELNGKSSVERNNQEKVTKESIAKLQYQHGPDNRRQEAYPKAQGEQDMDLKRMTAYSKQKIDQGINMIGMDANFMPQLPAPPSSLPTARKESHSTETLNSYSARIFTIATLQQCTNSFSEENFVGEGTLGSVYRAELPSGKLLAVKKLKGAASKQQTDDEFLQLVSSISKIQHDNILEFVGYCNEHGQRLLVYEYCKQGTLYDALHVDEEIHRKLTWNVRIRVALGAARALQYLHEVCQPPIVHWSFKSSNILLDDKLVACVSDCGLAPLKSSGFATEVYMERFKDGLVVSIMAPNGKARRCMYSISLSGRFPSSLGYGAPELELGSYTCSSDVYSFGVVMLELLTGRKSYDRSLSRGEQSLVRWAIHQLHDIDSLSRMVDPSLHGAYPVKSLSRFADIISRCIQREPEFRPPVSEIVQDLLHML